MAEGHGGCFQFIEPCIFYERKGVETLKRHFGVLKAEQFMIRHRSFSRTSELKGLIM